MTMRAISLYQPYASLWLSPRKIHETRHWSTPHRGPLVVHAAKKLERYPGTAVAELCVAEFGKNWADLLPCGAILGLVTMVDCAPTESVRDCAEPDDRECGDFGDGRWAWKRSTFRLLKEPIPRRGMQGLFPVDCPSLDIVWQEMSR